MTWIEQTKFGIERWRRRRWLARAFRDPDRDIIELVYFARITGMFGQLSGCLRAAEVAERSGKRLVVRLTSDNYRDDDADPEWFSDFFVNKAEPDLSSGQQPAFMRDGSDLPFDSTYTTLSEAKDLFDRHFAVRPDFEAEVDEFANANSIGSKTLAIHYRGTDKHTEAPTQVIADVLDRVARHADTLDGIENVFVASDEVAFIDLASKGIAGLPVFALDDAVRSDDEVPVHIQSFQTGNRAMGRDALLNCLMLARCGWMCRTSSFLSAWSAIFNPDIQIAMLNEPYSHTTWLPEKIILPKSQRI